MANQEALKSLKELPQRIFTSSTKERRLIFEDLVKIVSSKDVPEPAVKGICRILSLTLLRYNDTRSRHLVEECVCKLLQHHHELSVKCLTSSLDNFAQNYRTSFVTESTGGNCLTAVSWSCEIIKTLLSKESWMDVYTSSLMQIQCVVVGAVLAADNQRLNKKCYKKLRNTWRCEGCVDLYASFINNDMEPTHHVVVLTSLFVTFLGESKETEVINKLKPVYLDLFLKSMLTGKGAKPPNYALGHLKPLLRHVTHDEFKQLILPAIQKSMLRNPETVLSCISAIIGSLNIDLSQYAKDLAKVLSGQLCSNLDSSQNEACEAYGLLAKQCSDSESLVDVVKYMFEVLNGSEGKLTVVSQRIAVLNSIGKLSQHSVSGLSAVHSVSADVAECFIYVLKQEVHEGTLVCALQNLSLWCLKLSSEIPKNLLGMLQTGISLKTASSPVRNAYVMCMDSCLHGNTMMQAAPVWIPLLVKSVEKAFSQANNVAIVTEGLTTACLLLKIHRAGLELNKPLNAILPTILDIEKSPFFAEKFMNQLSDEGLVNLLLLCEKLIIDHHHSILGNSRMMYAAVLYIFTKPNHYLHKQSKLTVKKIVEAFDTSDVSRSLVIEFYRFLDDKIVAAANDSEEDQEKLSDTYNHLAVDCLYTISSVKYLNSIEAYDEVKDLAIDCLMASNHPFIFTVDTNAWDKILLSWKVTPSEFVAKHADIIFDRVIKSESSVMSNAIKTIVRISGENMLPKICNFAIEILNNPDLAKVTMLEFGVFMTPEDEVYDRSCIESVKEEVMSKNIKRESKLYSYKDQMEEVELRKELEAKKKAKRIKNEPQLTKKQQELLKLQMEKEDAVRKKINQLNRDLSQAVFLLYACLDGNLIEFGHHISDLLPPLMANLLSPLCAGKLSKLFVEISRCLSPSLHMYLGLAVSYVTLRLYEPSCELNPDWLEENLDRAVSRVMSTLHKITCPKLTGYIEDDVESDISRSLMTAPAFSYCYSLFKQVLKLDQSKYESEICQALDIITEHAQMRKSSSIDEETEEFNPSLFPVYEMFKSLISILCSSTGRIQVVASKAMMEVAKCVSGDDGCASAADRDILLLLDGLLYSDAFVRESVLRAFLTMLKVLATKLEDPDLDVLFTRRIYVAKFDTIEDNASLAELLWSKANLEVIEELGEQLLVDISFPAEIIRQSSAEALADFLETHTKSVKPTIKSLISIYNANLEMPAPVLDNFGRMISEPPVDPWEPRSGIAFALNKMASILSNDDVRQVMSFFVPDGLGDRHPDVRKNMLNAAVAVIDFHGKEQVSHLLSVFEEFLDQAPNTSTYDTIRQSVIILMGSLARHLDKSDPKVKPIVYKLIDALSTPSQQVQEAVANCLPPLVPAVKDEAPMIVRKLLDLLLESDKYGERKGAAYGLAGLVKGLGILALKQLDIMNSLTTAIQNKKNHKHREGALFAFEILCNMLGRLFEPYVVHVLPHLLLCFGDNNQYVREAADDTAKAVMSKLSAHGVKLVLPSLLAALEEDSWRTKTGSVELLGAMAYCAPKQLSSCLPSIVPKLIEVLSDSHIKTQIAGAQALKMIGSVIRNPEIQAIVSVLLEALQDPTKKTAICLGKLLNTKFVHFIDAPSLALIMPVVQRAFQDRSTETRKMAAQIIGNMYSLTDQKDLGPYLPTITPGLQQSLLDPVPEVRCVSARALGAMVKGMGETCFEDLMPWLMTTLVSERSSVDRSGAAQGLSEVIGGLGVEKLHKLMPEIISTAERVDIMAHVKDGYMMLFIYLPVVFPKEFTKYIGEIINPILKALADENEYVRETALRAGQRIVNMYAESAIVLLLPQLEGGLFDENWRIRYSSVQLLGDLLYKISGVSGKMTTETASEDDNFGTEASHKIILNILGGERRNRVLAGLYMGRSDTALMVRQAALHVWKIIVTNTPRTLREILPTLFSLLLGCLASTSYDKRQVAARTLGDLVRKLGERVLPEIIPILEKGLASDQADQRQGVCIGLSEIMTSTSKEMVLTFVDSLVPTVRKALCDPLPEVRQAAAKTFDSLHTTVGSRALDDILPQLLDQLAMDDAELAEYTLDGLKNVMAIKSRVVLPYLVPQLTAEPVNTKALSFLSAVAGDSLNRHLPKILPALLSALNIAANTPHEQQEVEYCKRVILSIQDEAGVRTIMDELMEATKNSESGVRRAAISLLHIFCCQTRANYSQYVSQLIRGLIHLFTDDDQQVLQLSWEALMAVTKTLDSSEQILHVATVRQAVRFAISDSKDSLLPGFCLSKGITPILPIFREAILNGIPEVKEQAATGLGEVIKVTSAEALQPSVVHITGPLIRILGDRFSWNVKASVLDTLALLLAKVGVRLKAFLPQLQTTFLKALNDPNRTVRLKAAAAVSHLIVIHTRVDQVFTDLQNAVKQAEESSVRETMLQALRGVIIPAGDKISDSVRKQVTQTVVGLLSHPEDETRKCAAGCVGALCRWLPSDELGIVVNENLYDDPSLDWILRHGRSIALFVSLKEAADKILTFDWTEKVLKLCLNYITSDRIPIVQSGIRCLAYFIQFSLPDDNKLLSSVPQSTWITFVKLMNHSSNEVKQLLAQAVQYLAKSCDKNLPDNVLRLLVPQLVNGTKEKNTVVKANSEYALVALLRLRQGDSTLQTCLNLLDSGAKDSLNDVFGKVLRRVASQAEPKEEVFDDTLLI